MGRPPVAAWSPWTLQVHWRIALATMRLAGMLGCGGWPPRPSRRWTYYAYIVMAVSVSARITIWYTKTTYVEQKTPDDLKIVVMLYKASTFMKYSGTVLIQVFVVHHSPRLALLARAVLQYSASYPGHGPARRPGKAALLLFFGLVAPAFYIVFTIKFAMRVGTWWTTIFCVNNIIMSVVSLGTTHDSFAHVVSASIDHLTAIADGVQEHVGTLQRRSPPVPSSAECLGCCSAHCPGPDTTTSTSASGALALRALRVRYQCVQDAVTEANQLYGIFNVVSNTLAMVEGVLCLYAGLIVAFFHNGIYKGNTMNMVWSLTWGTVLPTKLIFFCIIGENMCREKSRIYIALETASAHHAEIDQQSKQEIKAFFHQVLHQEIRFGILGFMFFDLGNMKRVVTCVITYLVVLSQFSAILNRDT